MNAGCSVPEIRIGAAGGDWPALSSQPSDVRAFVINPRRDKAFVDMVEGDGLSARSPGDLEARLREEYPRAIVRPRQLEGERAEVWYVYREGMWVSE
jgi:hypothetical protein